MIELTQKQKEVLATDGHALVKGGPGSGKTTISILKAGNIIKKERLRRGQCVLFLSFARATVFRVLEAIDEENALPREVKRQIEVDTYHAFFWRLIKTHGYLLGLPRRLNILTPHNEAIALSEIRNGYKSDGKLSAAERIEKKEREDVERLRFAMEEGLVCFDLFADLVGQLLGSNKIRGLIANAYPTIILDEFQDTAVDQWNVIQALGRDSDLLALADPEQRIFDFIGADPERLNHFIEEFKVVPIDLCDENHRSKGTDIVHFGNDILRGRYSKSSYYGIVIKVFDPYKNQATTKVVTETLQARKRLIENGPKDWSLAILVPTKRMTRLVSDVFRKPLKGLSRIEHYAAVDMEAAILAAEIIAYGLQSHGATLDAAEFVTLIANYFRGKGGNTPSKTGLQEASRILKAYETAVGRRTEGKDVLKKSVFLPIEAAILGLSNLNLTGDPDSDWLTIRGHFAEAGCKRLVEIATEVQNIRLLERGTHLREALSQNWRDNGFYADALEIVRQAFIRDHFATNTKREIGVIVMNMHKAKGKQFDEVIVFEGWPRTRRRKIVANPDRIVRGNLHVNIDDQVRQNFRVSVTRAKRQTTILTPQGNPCVLLRDPAAR